MEIPQLLEGGGILILCWLVLRTQAEIRDTLAVQTAALTELRALIMLIRRGDEVV